MLKIYYMHAQSLVKSLAALCTVLSDSIYSHSHWIKSLRGERTRKSCPMRGGKPWQVCKAPLLESHTHTHIQFKHTYKHAPLQIYSLLYTEPFFFFCCSPIWISCAKAERSAHHTVHLLSSITIWCGVCFSNCPLNRQRNTPEAFRLQSFLDLGHFSWCF